jgi:hypothetical protein
MLKIVCSPSRACLFVYFVFYNLLWNYLQNDLQYCTKIRQIHFLHSRLCILSKDYCRQPTMNSLTFCLLSASHTEIFTLCALTLNRWKIVLLHDLNWCFEQRTRLVLFPYHVVLSFIISLSHSYFFNANLSPTTLLLSISFCFSYIRNRSRFYYFRR